MSRFQGFQALLNVRSDNYLPWIGKNSNFYVLIKVRHLDSNSLNIFVHSRLEKITPYSRSTSLPPGAYSQIALSKVFSQFFIRKYIYLP